MARIVLGGLTTLNTSTHLDPMFLELYNATQSIVNNGVVMGYGAAGSAWGASNTRAMQMRSVSSGGATVALSAVLGTDELFLSRGCYYNGSSFAYVASGTPVGAYQIASNGQHIWQYAASGTAGATFSFTTLLTLGTAGDLKPGSDNTQPLGGASNRFSVVYAGTGTINTSDAREKTEVSPMTEGEIAASKQLAAAVGTFRFLSAVAEKGDRARMHIGMTVQHAIEIMTANDLDPMAYGFICHDRWPDSTIPARTEPRKTGLFNAQGEEITEQVEIEPARVVKGGDRYGFRTDELLLFLARGFDARLAAMES